LCYRCKDDAECHRASHYHFANHNGQGYAGRKGGKTEEKGAGSTNLPNSAKIPRWKKCDAASGTCTNMQCHGHQAKRRRDDKTPEDLVAEGKNLASVLKSLPPGVVVMPSNWQGGTTDVSFLPENFHVSVKGDVSVDFPTTRSSIGEGAVSPDTDNIIPRPTTGGLCLPKRVKFTDRVCYCNGVPMYHKDYVYNNLFGIPTRQCIKGCISDEPIRFTNNFGAGLNAVVPYFEDRRPKYEEVLDSFPVAPDTTSDIPYASKPASLSDGPIPVAPPRDEPLCVIHTPEEKTPLLRSEGDEEPTAQGSRHAYAVEECDFSCLKEETDTTFDEEGYTEIEATASSDSVSSGDADIDSKDDESDWGDLNEFLGVVKEEDPFDRSDDEDETVWKGRPDLSYDVDIFDHAVNKKRMLHVENIWVFTNHAEVKPVKLKMSLRLKRMLAKHTILGSYEQVLPTNENTVLSEERSDSIKGFEAFRWFASSHYDVVSGTNLYHAFRDAYTHATMSPVYHNIAAHFLANRNAGRMTCAEGKTGAAVKRVNYSWMQEYFSAHPLRSVMDRTIMENTKDHIVNQMVILGFRERAREPRDKDKGEGLIAVPFTSGIFGNRQSFGKTTQSTATKTSTNEIAMTPLFRTRVPSKTKSPEGIHFALA